MAFLVGQNNNSWTDTGLLASSHELLFHYHGYSASESGTATSAYIRVSDWWTCGAVKVCVYNSSGSLQATATISAGSAGWNSAALSSNVTITSGQTYYLGVILDTGYCQVYLGPTQWEYDNDTSGSYASPPSSISVPGAQDLIYPEFGIYLDGTTGGGSSSTPSLKRRLNILLRLCLSSFSTLFGRLLR